MPKPNILVGEKVFNSWWNKVGFNPKDLYGTRFNLIREADIENNDSLLAEVQCVVASTLFSRIDPTKFTGLKMVCNPFAGLDGMARHFSTLKKMDVKLVYNPGVPAIPAADQALSLMLSSARQIPVCE